MTNFSISTQLKFYLKEHGIKQTYLAQKLGRTDNEMSMLLNGKVKMSADELIKILDVLAIPLNELTDLKIKRA